MLLKKSETIQHYFYKHLFVYLKCTAIFRERCGDREKWGLEIWVLLLYQLVYFPKGCEGWSWDMQKPRARNSIQFSPNNVPRFEPFSVTFPGMLVGAGMKVVESGLDSGLQWNVDLTGRHLTCCITALVQQWKSEPCLCRELEEDGKDGNFVTFSDFYFMNFCAKQISKRGDLKDFMKF